MKRFISILTLFCTATVLSAMLVGCEPNVPENDNNENTLDVNDTLERNNTNDVNHNTEEPLEPFDSEPFDEFDTNEPLEPIEPFDSELEGNPANEHTAAVEGDSTADFAADLDGQVLPLYGRRIFPKYLSGSNNPNANDFTHLSNKKIGWGPGKHFDEDNRPADAIKANGDYSALGATFIGEREPLIYLTFDEGYENGYTAAILDTLKAKRAKATFFVTYDYCKSSPELVRRMIDEGHAVGNHSYSHPSFPDCSVEQIREEIGKLHDYVKETFEYEMRLIRFPMGEFSERSLAVSQEMGYTSVFWSFAYPDWNVNNQPEPAASLEKIKGATHPGGIFLLHAVSKTNATILGDLIDYWHSNGYRLTVIGEEIVQV
ncbi:MAG: polysaccharide deacetylase family protein [Oscillospiraceae bacterium]|nr:polysaccharide deacetylase family protein [Oscillospiraceae bacterium]